MSPLKHSFLILQKVSYMIKRKKTFHDYVHLVLPLSGRPSVRLSIQICLQILKSFLLHPWQALWWGICVLQKHILAVQYIFTQNFKYMFYMIVFLLLF